MPNNASSAPLPLILTRPRAASDVFFANLPETVQARLDPVFSPLIDIVALDQDYELGPQDYVVFSSRNGVDAAPDGNGRIAYCIGPATTQAAIAKGWRGQRTGNDADSLVAALADTGAQARLVHLSGVHTRGDIAGRLSQAGLNITNIAIYDQVLRPLSRQAQHVIETMPRVLVPLFSPRTAGQFVVSTPRLSSVHVIALSAAVSQHVPQDAVSSLVVATSPNAQAMSVAVEEAIAKA